MRNAPQQRSPGDSNAWHERTSWSHLLEETTLRLRQGTDTEEMWWPTCRDTVQLYQQLHASGLQYGPAFRLLRNVHTPDLSAP